LRHLDASRCPCGRPRALLYLFGRVCWGAGTARESRAFMVAEVYSFVVLRAARLRYSTQGAGRRPGSCENQSSAERTVAPVGESRVAGEPDRTVRRVYATRTRRVAIGFCIEYSVLIISLFDSCVTRGSTGLTVRGRSGFTGSAPGNWVLAPALPGARTTGRPPRSGQEVELQYHHAPW